MSSVGTAFETTITPVEHDWFAAQIDRDHKTHYYGNGIRLYKPDGNYTLIKGVEYDPETNTLIGESSGVKISINTEPNIDLFKIILYEDWNRWDSIYGLDQDVDRCDYEPWMLDSIKALAIELNVYTPKEGETITMYYGKSYTRCPPIKIQTLIDKHFEQIAAFEQAGGSQLPKSMIDQFLKELIQR